MDTESDSEHNSDGQVLLGSNHWRIQSGYLACQASDHHAKPDCGVIDGRLLIKIGYKSPDDFYSAIGINSLKLSLTLLRKLYPAAYESKKREIKQLDRKQKATQDIQINVEGLTNIETKLAKLSISDKGYRLFRSKVTTISHQKINTKIINSCLL